MLYINIPISFRTYYWCTLRKGSGNELVCEKLKATINNMCTVGILDCIKTRKSVGGNRTAFFYMLGLTIYFIKAKPINYVHVNAHWLSVIT